MCTCMYMRVVGLREGQAYDEGDGVNTDIAAL